MSGPAWEAIARREAAAARVVEGHRQGSRSPGTPPAARALPRAPRLVAGWTVLATADGHVWVWGDGSMVLVRTSKGVELRTPRGRFELGDADLSEVADRLGRARRQLLQDDATAGDRPTRGGRP